MRKRAAGLGLEVSEQGIFDGKGRRLGGATEEDVFRAAGLPFIPPELREGALVISSDSHYASNLANLRYGVWMARRGWAEAKDVLNTRPLPDLRRRARGRAMVALARAPGRRRTGGRGAKRASARHAAHPREGTDTVIIHD